MVQKCGLCSKRVKNYASIEKNRCSICKKIFHFKCLGLIEGSKSTSWNCQACLFNNLHFFELDNPQLKLTLQARSVDDSTGLKLLPNFTIQSLLDKIPGSFTIETDEFVSDSTVSKYYKINEFMSTKIPKNAFPLFIWILLVYKVTSMILKLFCLYSTTNFLLLVFQKHALGMSLSLF